MPIAAHTWIANLFETTKFYTKYLKQVFGKDQDISKINKNVKKMKHFQ